MAFIRFDHKLAPASAPARARRILEPRVRFLVNLSLHDAFFLCLILGYSATNQPREVLEQIAFDFFNRPERHRKFHDAQPGPPLTRLHSLQWLETRAYAKYEIESRLAACRRWVG